MYIHSRDHSLDATSQMHHTPGWRRIGQVAYELVHFCSQAAEIEVYPTYLLERWYVVLSFLAGRQVGV
jgi:hypothetical protein